MIMMMTMMMMIIIMTMIMIMTYEAKYWYKLLVVTETKTVPCLDPNSIVIMIRFGTLQGRQLLLMCHKFFSGDNLILSHTVMVITDSKKQKNQTAPHK